MYTYVCNTINEKKNMNLKERVCRRMCREKKERGNDGIIL